MPVLIRIEPDTGLAVAACSGVLRLREAKEGAAALWKTPGWSGKSVVWDFWEAQFDLSPSDLQDMARFIFHHQPKMPPAKVAFVTPRDVNFGLARMFAVFREDPRTQFHVFRDYEEAIAWARPITPLHI